MKGFYRSKYTTPSGEIRYAAVTQFEVWYYFLKYYDLKLDSLTKMYAIICVIVPLGAFGHNYIHDFGFLFYIHPVIFIIEGRELGVQARQ